MKRICILLALILMLSMTSACERLPADTDGPSQTSEAFVPEPAEPDENGGGPAGEEPASVTDTEPAAASAPTDGPAAQPASDTDARPDAVEVRPMEGMDGLPEIVAPGEGAAAINEDIRGRFGYLVGEDYCRLRYEVHDALATGVLSVLVVTEYEDDSRFYMPYNLDLETGEWLEGKALCARLGLSEEELADAELSVMGAEFEYRYAAERDRIGPEVYDEQYERTVAPENAELGRIWLGDGGQLMFAAKIYGFAGAEFYEYAMPVGCVFP